MLESSIALSKQDISITHTHTCMQNGHNALLNIMAMQNNIGGRFGVAVTALVTSMKLSYVEPG